MIKFQTSTWRQVEIEAVEVERETDCYLIIDGRRNAKRSDYDNYFNTWDQARDWLLEQAEWKVEHVRESLAEHEVTLAKIKAMKDPTRRSK